MITESFSPIVTTIGGGFLTGMLIGWALKKVIKLCAIMVGLFLAGLGFLQYQQIVSFDLNRIEGLLTSTLGNTTSQISNSQYTATFALFDFGIPLTSSMSAGFGIGFMKG
jgi:uncharacterized membrane protein (Fun14 family)